MAAGGFVLAVSAIACSTAHATPYQIQTIAVPGAQATTAWGINNSGSVSGSYGDGSGQQGFVFDVSGGTFARFDIPGGNGGIVHGINDGGEIVGGFHDDQQLSSPFRGFVRSADGTTFTAFGDHATEALGINNEGIIVGIHVELTGGYGFIRNANGETQLFSNSLIYGVNNLGATVGAFGDVAAIRLADGTLEIIGDAPSNRAFAPFAINDTGDVVGAYQAAAPSRAFIQYADGQIDFLDIVGAETSRAFGINNLGQIVGDYITRDGQTFGFIATPLPEPAGFFGVALFLCAYARRRITQAGGCRDRI
jgi:hypothetical protein